ncbi:Asp-tRNA(Asn)/Glu-tRNA(Gln) amidotransferase subunit GatB [Patescibacteria group bacterium]
MYNPTIGLEIHAELNTKSKIFCSCKNDLSLGKEPNINICPVCAGQPGSLPVINKQAVENIIKIGIALDGKPQKEFRFFRKNYFYPDIPKGYQITSQEAPPIIGGRILVGDRQIKIHHVHLEEDTGKNTHPEGTNYSLIDYNRAGVPLMELVTEPDMKNGKEASLFCQELQHILRVLDVSDADMEKGQMRCEVNVSISKNEKLGTKVEIKNLNSFRAVEKAIDFEINRQENVIESGENIIQETRGWNDKDQKTFAQRSKETAKDYRYFPEPDLPPVKVGDEWIKRIKSDLPEMPQTKRKRFIEQYGFNQASAHLLILNKNLSNFTEQVISELKAWLITLEGVEGSEDEIWTNNKEKLVKLVSGWLINKLPPLMQEYTQDWDNLKITAENFAEFITLIYQNKISSAIGQKLLKEMIATGKDPSNIIEENDLSQISNGGEIDEIIDKVIKNNPEQVAEFKSGKENVIQYLIGQIMKESKGKANPQMAGEMLREKLK